MNATIKNLARKFQKLTLARDAARLRLAAIETKINETNGERLEAEREIHLGEQRHEERLAAEILGELPIEDKTPIEALRARVKSLDVNLKALNKAKKETIELIASHGAEEEKGRGELANALHQNLAQQWNAVLAEHRDLLLSMAMLQWTFKTEAHGTALFTNADAVRKDGDPRWRMFTGSELDWPGSLTDASAKEWFAQTLAELLAPDDEDEAPSATDDGAAGVLS